MQKISKKGYSPPILARELYDQLGERGYLGPFRVLSEQECKEFLKATSDEGNQPPLDWGKGHAASSRAFYEIGTHPKMIDVVASLLGNDVMLWGAGMAKRNPGAIHPWHTDIEATGNTGQIITVWIGLDHTTPESSLVILPYSHHFGVTVQEVRHRFGKGRDETTNDDIIRWGQEQDQRAHLLRPKLTNGEALFFDGRLWHSSHNLFHKTRRALVLQYATPDTVIRIPDSNYLDWPIRLLKLPKPPCLMVRGCDKAGVNRIVPPPVPVNAGSRSRLTNRIYPLEIPLLPDNEKGWKPYSIFKGSTANARSLTCHVSVLNQDHCPHPPHTHKEEELLLLLAGEVDLILPDVEDLNGAHRKRLKAGQFVYYPAYFAHTLQTVSQEPANYLMFKWNSDPTNTDTPLMFGHYNMSDYLADSDGKKGFKTRRVFEGPTAYFRKLQCHTSTVTPGAGYDPHIDAHDVAIIVLEGEVETLGERVGAHSVIFYPAGEPHGLRNPGKRIAKYVVFEFHGSQTGLTDHLRHTYRRPSLLDRLTDPQCWKRKLKHLLRDFRGIGA